MFLKLVKQDVRATARLMLPVYAAALVLAVFVRVFDAIQNSMTTNSRFVGLLATLVVMLFSLAMTATVVMSFVLMIWRFHKNYMTDEGYLMFTLPVTTAQLILSKLLVAVGWFLCSALVVAASTAIASFHGGFEGSIEIIGFDEIPVAQLRQLAVSGTVLTLVAGVAGCLMLYACMAVGQSFRSRKTLMAVVCFFAFYIVSQIVGVRLLSGALEIAPETTSFLMDSKIMLEFANSLLWRFTAVSAVFAVIYYAITHFMLAKKLNLQ